MLSSPEAPETQLPQRVDNEGVEPVLAVNLSDDNAVATWLADRIGEIERSRSCFRRSLFSSAAKRALCHWLTP
jgi:hypothetical protein